MEAETIMNYLGRRLEAVEEGGFWTVAIEGSVLRTIGCANPEDAFRIAKKLVDRLPRMS